MFKNNDLRQNRHLKIAVPLLKLDLLYLVLKIKIVYTVRWRQAYKKTFSDFGINEFTFFTVSSSEALSTTTSITSMVINTGSAILTRIFTGALIYICDKEQQTHKDQLSGSNSLLSRTRRSSFSLLKYWIVFRRVMVVSCLDDSSNFRIK